MSGNAFFVLVVALMVASIQEGEARGTYTLQYYQPQAAQYQPQAAQYVQYVPQAYAEAAKQVQYYSAPTCYCYGHSYQCAAQGVCANCQHNTVGNMCQFCSPGYTGMATRGTAYDCQPIQTQPLQYMQYYYQPQAAALEAPLHVKQAAASYVQAAPAYAQAAPMHVKQPEAFVQPAAMHVKDAAATAYVAPAAAYAAPARAFKQPE